MNEHKNAATARQQDPARGQQCHEAAPGEQAEQSGVVNGGSSAVPLLSRTEKEAGGHYQRLLQSVPAIICELAPDGTTLFVNDMLAAITGYRPDALLGKSWWKLFCPGELYRQVEVLYRRLQAADVRDYEMVLAARDGSHRVLLWQFSNQYLLDGTLESVVGYGVDITEHKRADDALQESVDKLKGLIEGTIEAMAMTVEIRDPYTAGHQRRVAMLACAIAEEMGVGQQQVEVIRLSGIVHDIGKISVPAEILSKPGRITRTELDLIRAHPQVGYAILKTIEFPWPIAQIVYQHHERLDGSGYPLGLSGENILFEARILGVADVVESMAGHRPYRPALGVDRAITEITKNRAILYDPKVVDACLKVIREIEFEWE